MAKILVDGMGARFAEGIAAIALLVWIGTRTTNDVSQLDPSWIYYAIAIGAVVWVIATRLVRMPPQCEDLSGASPRFPESCVLTTTLGGPVSDATDA